MEHTACGDECAFVKSGFCKTDKECPFYTEGWWNNPNEPQPKLFRDCFPKRNALEQQGLLSRFLCLQATVQELRNQIFRLEGLMIQLVQKEKEMITTKNCQSIESATNEAVELPYQKLNSEGEK